MARRRYTIDEKRIARFEKEGRGQGERNTYKPWLTIQDVPSHGRSHRLLGMTTGRIHHFLSDLERDLFYLLDWQETVLDIREQFPLERAETTRIADALNIRHPCVPGEEEPLVMTTDFVVEQRHGSRTQTLAYAVKPATDLEKPRCLHKLEIERRYWQERGIDWVIVTRAELPARLIGNIAWVHSFFRPGGLEQRQREQASVFQDRLIASPLLSLRQFCSEMDEHLGWRPGDSLTLIRHLLSIRAVRCDMASVELNDELPLSALQFPDDVQGRSRK